MLERARKIVASQIDEEIKDATRAQYERQAQLYFSSDLQALERVLATKSRNTYQVRKAALKWKARQELQAAIDTGDMARLGSALAVWDWFESRAGSVPIASSKRRSKRLSLRGLPVDWREQVVQALEGHKARDWALLMSVAGVRPSEVAGGVYVEPAGHDGVQVTVRGTKIDRDHGQPLRVFVVRGAMAELLAAGGRRIIQAVSANAVSTALGRAGRKLWPHRFEKVAAYTFRHQLASDLKAAKLGVTEASAILGHSVTDTKRFYGNSRSSRGDLRFALVHATREVKISPSRTELAMRYTPGSSASMAGGLSF